jgi:hypothetical protein
VAQALKEIASVKIAHNTNGGPPLADGDVFGGSVASLGDFDGDGVTDLAVGAYSDNTGGYNRGAVHVLFMNANGTVKSRQKIAHNTSGGPALANDDHFGTGVASLGDLDGDGVTDLAVGSRGNDTGGNARGAVYVLLMNANGTVKSLQKIAHNTGGGPALADGDVFGGSVASLGDVDGDGVTDLAVGAYSDNTGGYNRGAVHVLFMNANGTVRSRQKIAHNTNGGPTLVNDDHFGTGVASLGDLDGDGVADIAVGSRGNDTGGNARGAVYVLFMNAAAATVGVERESTGQESSLSLANSEPNQIAKWLGLSGEQLAATARESLPPVLAPVPSLVIPYRPVDRGSLGAQQTLAMRRDQALVDWLASQRDVQQQLDESGEIDVWRSDDESKPEDSFIGTLDHVFALLAVG